MCVVMDFSKKYLLKYGWQEGQGLGKTRSGIKNAIKPKLKFDKAGVGFDPSQEFTNHWWEKVYNDALKDKSSNEDKLLVEHEETSLSCHISRQTKKLEKDFTSLLKACEGRTAHKGARHGLQLSGKLQRLEHQEKTLLGNNCNKLSYNYVKDTEVNPKVALKKSKKMSKSSEKTKLVCNQDNNEDVVKKCSTKSIKKRKLDNM